MPPTASINRARIHACTTPNAIKRPSKIGLAQHLSSSIIDQNNMHHSTWPWLVEMRRISGNRLPCGTSCQQSEEHAQMIHFRNQFFYAHASNMYRCEMSAHISIAFIRTYHETACFCNSKVYAGNSHIGL